jgi:hypothetical protein
LYFFTYQSTYIVTINKLIFNPLESIQTAFAFTAISLVIVLLSKEKALGFGDVYYLTIASLILGSLHSLIAIYIAIFLSLIFVAYSSRVKKTNWKLIKVPLIFFMMFGSLISLILTLYF